MNMNTLSRIFSMILIVLALVHHIKFVRAKTLKEALEAMQHCNWSLAFAILVMF